MELVISEFDDNVSEFLLRWPINTLLAKEFRGEILCEYNGKYAAVAKRYIDPDVQSVCLTVRVALQKDPRWFYALYLQYSHDNLLRYIPKTLSIIHCCGYENIDTLNGLNLCVANKDRVPEIIISGHHVGTFWL